MTLSQHSPISESSQEYLLEEGTWGTKKSMFAPCVRIPRVDQGIRPYSLPYLIITPVLPHWDELPSLIICLSLFVKGFQNSYCDHASFTAPHFLGLHQDLRPCVPRLHPTRQVKYLSVLTHFIRKNSIPFRTLWCEVFFFCQDSREN